VNLYEGAYRGDRDDIQEPHVLPALAVTLAGIIFLLGAAFLLHSGFQNLPRGSYETGEKIEHLLVGWTLGWFGLLLLGWGMCEFFCKVPGPRILFSLLCVVPVLVPFSFLGYGSETEAWSSALAAEWLHKTGNLLTANVSISPLFIRLLTLLQPLGGWTAVYTAQLIAGIGAVLIWILLPSEIAVWRRRLIALGILVHPLFLVSCGTGLDPVWQCVCLSTSVVLLLQGLTSDGAPYGYSLASGFLLGLAAGFRWPCLVFLPVWILSAALFETSFSRKVAAFFILSVSTIFSFTASLALKPGGMDFPTIPGVFPSITHLGYHLLHDVFPPPLLILLAIAIWRLRRDWYDLEESEQVLCVLSLTGLVAGGILFGVFHESAGPMTVLIPMASALVGVLVPRGLVAMGLPLLALWGVLSVPILPAHPAQEVGLQLSPCQGILVEEASERFDRLRKAQQLLLASQKRNTVFVVGEEWPLLAMIHPDWVVEAGTLRNPTYAVEFRDWIDLDTFRALRLEEFRFYVVGDAGHINRAKFGYDLFEEGATSWEP
jgi:hypothetical protein